MKAHLRLHEQLAGRTDHRGTSYTLPAEALAFLGSVAEVHAADVLPGAVRGNHYHEGRSEALLVTFNDGCRVAWALPGKDMRVRTFQGRGAILLAIGADVAHAVENTGHEPLQLISCSNKIWDPRQGPDTFPRILLDSSSIGR